jgi:hypothetical protein
MTEHAFHMASPKSHKLSFSGFGSGFHCFATLQSGHHGNVQFIGVSAASRALLQISLRRLLRQAGSEP